MKVSPQHEFRPSLDPTPFKPSGLPCLRIDDVGRRAVAREISRKSDGSHFVGNPWVGEMYRHIDTTTRVPIRNVVINREERYAD